MLHGFLLMYKLIFMCVISYQKTKKTKENERKNGKKIITERRKERQEKVITEIIEPRMQCKLL